ncbi:MAG: hypothetical protein KC592_14920, partial [Nitrospira sp.]|nr:hypothetical protein [Nitrospira sp.]
MLTKTIRILFLLLFLQGFITASAMAEATQSNTTPAIPSGPKTDATLESFDGATTVELDRAVHFTTPEDTDVVVPAGTYEVQSTGTGTLQLTLGGESPLVIAAGQSPHTYQVEQTQPIAVALPGEDEDSLHILFTQVGGESLEATGSYSGIQSRGPNIFVSPSRAHVWLQSKAYTSSLPS